MARAAGLTLLLLLLLALSACVSQEGDTIPISTPSPTLAPSPSLTTPTMAPPSPTPTASTPDSPTPTVVPDLPSPLPGWAWYQGSCTGYCIVYPQSWTKYKHWGRYTQPPRGNNPGPIQERVVFQSAETGSEVIVDVWDVTALPDFDLLTWVNTRPEALLFTDSTEPVTYNATLLGQPALFYYSPAEWGTGDMATLIFATAEYAFRIFFTGTAMPMLQAEPAIYLHMLESFSLPGRPAAGVDIPTGWEQGAGLIVRAAPPDLDLAALPPDELLPYRQGLVGEVADWDEARIYDMRFTLLTDAGQRYAIYAEPFRAHFQGLPIDYAYHSNAPRPQDGDRLRVAGQPLASGEVLAQYIAIQTNDDEWQTWFDKTLFTVTRDEFEPLLLSNYPPGETVWLRGPLEQTLAFLVSESGNPIGSEEFSPYLEQNALAHGVLQANGALRVELQDLYVQDGPCTKISDHEEHYPFWKQLYPPVSTTTTTITATVLESDPEARIIVLQQPVAGFVTITLTPDGQLLTADGQPMTWKEIVGGSQVQASGEVGGAGTLLADRVQLIP